MQPARFLRNLPWQRICDVSITGVLVFSVLWRGGKSLEATWILSGLAAFLSVVSVIEGRRSTSEERYELPFSVWILTLTFVVLTVASYTTSQTGNYGLDEVFRTVSLALIFFWVARRARRVNGEKSMEKLMKILCVTALVACVIGIFVYVLQPVNRFVGTFFDFRFHTDYWPNAFAEFLLLTWPLTLWWTKKLRFGSVLPGILFGCLLLTYSRGAALVFLFQLLVLGGLLLQRTGRQFPWKPLLRPVLISLGIAIALFLSVNVLRQNFYEVQNVSEKITFTADEGTSSVSDRTQFFRQATALTLERPLLGWGPYSFRFVQTARQEGVLATSDHPHNVFLKLAMERGIPAAAIFLLLLGIILVPIGVSFVRGDRDSGPERLSLSFCLSLGLLGVLAHNMIDFNMQFVGIALPSVVFLSFLLAREDLRPRLRIPSSLARSVEALLALVLLLFAITEGMYLISSSLGRHAEVRGDYEAAVKWYGRSHEEIFTRDLFLSEARSFQALDRQGAAQESLSRYFEENSHDARAWKMEGDSAFAKDDFEGALEAYEAAYVRGKWNDLGILKGMLATLLTMNQRAVIDARKNEFDALLFSFEQAVTQNTHFVALSQNPEEFVSIANIFAELYPNEAPRYQVSAARVDHHAEIEREKLASRSPGFLW